MTALFKKEMRIHLDTADSTNTYLRDLSGNREIPEGTLVRADYQTQGRGHGKNFWESEQGKNLTFSFLLKPDFMEPSEQFLISKIVSLALSEFFSQYTSGIKIKWPNDICTGSGKVAGILIENTLQGNNISKCIVGIGMNINQTEFLSDAPNPVSLKMLTGRIHNPDECLEEICRILEKWYVVLRSGRRREIDNKYLESLYLLDEFAQYEADNNSFAAKIKGVDEFGRLCLEKTDGCMKVFGFHEVRFL
ncbi:MAG: biotin--[acetyl-CoA-carboxylase] ligase [Bacteroidetes bacterium]|nr:biotin--[acetyl-CoA-carboxylase] ligase [Bacteroidota bacterium]